MDPLSQSVRPSRAAASRAVYRLVMEENLAARGFFVTSPGVGEIRPLSLTPPGPEQVLVESLYSGVSRGTESLVFHGRVPASEHERMRAPFQEGEFTLPVKYGYASVGRVLSGPYGQVGQLVFCLFPHQDRYVVDSRSVLAIPQGVPAERAVLAANMETAINGLWDARPQLGDRIAVVGAGVVGALVAYLAARIPGTEVQLVDIEPRRAELAHALGCRFAEPGQAQGDADLVVHASGAPAGLTTALALAGREATIVEMSWYGDQPVPAPLGQAFHACRLRLISSQVGGLPAGQKARWSYRRRLSLALSLLRDPALERLISGECSFAELPAVMARITQPSHASTAPPVLCQRVRYPAAVERG